VPVSLRDVKRVAGVQQHFVTNELLKPFETRSDRVEVSEIDRRMNGARDLVKVLTLVLRKQ